MFTPRTLLNRIKKSLKISPVVLLTGARQTGKTTLVKKLAKEIPFTYVTFDNLRYLAAAKNDPMGFLAGMPKPLILDEVQRVPEIFLPIKQDVDENRHPGRYLLTGSANPLLIPKIGDSLAGRMEIFRLFPFSQGELMHAKEHFVETLFEKNFLDGEAPSIPRDVLCEIMVVGGYPVMQTFEEEDALESWFNAYVTSLVQKDVQELARVEGLAQLPNLLNILASRAGNLLNVHELSRSSGIAATTLHRYLQLLQTLFLVDLVSPWSTNMGKRFVKSPKICLSDTGLLCFLIGANQERLLAEPNLMGNIFENFVIAELLKQISWSSKRIKLYHSRTLSGSEVDVILENARGEVVAIEIKGNAHVDFAAFKGISELKKRIGTRFKRGIVLYLGGEKIPFAEDLFALPLSLMWKGERPGDEGNRDSGC